MASHTLNTGKSMFRQMRKTISIVILVAFIGTSVKSPAYAVSDQALALPAPGTMVNLSPAYEPALIKGLTVHQDNPFLFDFIVDPGQSKLPKEFLKEESDRMIKYFFAALTIPDTDIWVNLSPYEKDRMIPESLGVTAMGRDLLAQDYMLKQLTASLIYPQKALGKTFWDTVYAKAKAMYGTTEIPVNTFNKVWIVPQRVGIYEHGQTAFIVDGHLKVMLEQDYLSMTKHNAISNTASASETKQSQVNQLGSQIIRQIVLPEIEKEVNDGKNFATLRQIFYAQALAVWFKHNLKQALLNRVYANKGTVKGIDQNNPSTNEAIYKQYLRAYKKGVFNYIKEDIDPITQETLPRKYFSGGYSEAMLASAIHPVELSTSAAGAQAIEAAHDVDATVVVDTNGADAQVLARNVDADLRVGGIDLRAIKITTSGPEAAAFLREFGLSVSSSSDLHVIVIDGQSIDLSQPQTFGQAFDREVQAVGALDQKDMTPEDKAMVGDLSTWFNVVLGLHFAGIATLSAAIVKSTHEFFKGKNATTMEVKREYYKRFNKDWMHIAGAATIVVTGIILGAMHGMNIDSIKLDLLAILTGSKIGGGIFGFEKMAGELVKASNATDNINDPKLKAVETFKGNPGRNFFFNYTDWPVMISLFAIAYAKFPASWNPTVLHHVIDFVNKVPHLGWILPVVPVLMGVGIGATLATQVDKNRPVKDAAMKIAKLRNGSEEPMPAVTTTTISLRHLMSSIPGILQVYELHQKALNPNYQIDRQYAEPLKALALLQSNGELHDITRNVVLSSVEGSGLEMRLVNPIVSTKDAAMTAAEIKVAIDKLHQLEDQILKEADNENAVHQGLADITNEFIASGQIQDMRIGMAVDHSLWRVFQNEKVRKAAIDVIGFLPEMAAVIWLTVLGRFIDKDTNVKTLVDEIQSGSSMGVIAFYPIIQSRVEVILAKEQDGEIPQTPPTKDADLSILKSMTDPAMTEKQSPQVINDQMTQYNPSKTNFTKKPVMGYRITSDRFEDIPLAIRQHLGAVDQSKYTPEYLRENIGSVILLQMKDDQPDFFVPPKASLSNYKEIGIDQVNAGNSDLIGHLTRLNVMQISGLVGMVTTEVVGMVKMSDIGYNIDDQVVIETPWGDQTKPAGKDAYLRWTDSLKQYTMVNSENGSNPINWVPADPAMAMQASNDEIILRSDLTPGHIDQINQELARLRNTISSQTAQNKKGKGFIETIPVKDRLTDENVARINSLRAVSSNGRIIIKVIKNGLDVYDFAMATADKAVVAKQPSWVQGGIDLSEQDSALQVTKDANGGVRVDVDPALIAHVEREGMSEVDPVIVRMQPADMQTVFGVASVR